MGSVLVMTVFLNLIGCEILDAVHRSVFYSRRHEWAAVYLLRNLFE